MILDDQKLIYIHIPKTGGNSVERAFSVPRWQRRGLIDAPFEVDTVEAETEPHLPASLLQRSFPERFDSYFKACFVRNPWDRIVSAYSWLREIRGLPVTFADWIAGDFEATPPRELNLFIRPDLLDWITVDGRVAMDFIGRFESIESDFAALCRAAGIERPRLRHWNARRHHHYSLYYDDRSRAMIGERYQREIDHFDFKFESIGISTA